LSSAAWTERERVEVKPAAAAKLVEVFIKSLRLAEDAAGLFSRFIARLRIWKDSIRKGFKNRNGGSGRKVTF
jgi:hypothetical protein